MTPSQALAVIDQERLDLLGEGATAADCEQIASYVLASAYRKLLAARPEAGAKEWNTAIEAAAEACVRRAALCGGRALPVNVGEVCAVSIRTLLRHAPQAQLQKEKP
jgi:hypothetical protein